jgi:hypothetical protein
MLRCPYTTLLLKAFITNSPNTKYKKKWVLFLTKLFNLYISRSACGTIRSTVLTIISAIPVLNWLDCCATWDDRLKMSIIQKITTVQERILLIDIYTPANMITFIGFAPFSYIVGQCTPKCRGLIYQTRLSFSL